jgi:6-phosphogluconolactonase
VITLTGNGAHPRQEASHPHSIVLSADDRFAYVPDLGTDKIMIYKVDYENGKLLPNEMPFVQLPAGSGPRHFTIHPNNKFAYAINELTSTVASFSFDPATGTLGVTGYAPTLPAGFRGDNLTADIHISPDGKYLYGSNRGPNSIAGFSIDGNSGTLSPVGHWPVQGTAPRNFMITDDGKLLYAANQNSGNITVFKIETNGSLSPHGQFEVPTPVCLKMR